MENGEWRMEDLEGDLQRYLKAKRSFKIIHLLALFKQLQSKSL